MSYMQDPNMEEARKEIVAILQKRDLMGAVTISGKTRSGFFCEISPTWSCAKMEETPQGPAIRIKSKREDYASLAEQKQHVELTVNGFMGLLEVHKFIGQTLLGVITLIGKKMDIHSVSTDHRIQKIDPSQDK